jgi:dephospho-CoA kinase
VIVVGLTGNIASGKSTVAALLAAHGAVIVDADVLARRAVEPGTPALAAIAARWGTGMLSPDGTLDRAALRRVVFQSQQELEALNAIVHPAVEQMRLAEVAAARARGDQLVVCDIPLLFEKQLEPLFDRVVLVDAPRPVRLERLMAERGLDEQEALRMIAAQMPAELKRARAHYVIENAGTREELSRRVDALWAALLRDADASVPVA